jgi:hypothetical protein
MQTKSFRLRNRHIPRLCHTCQAPMARQENSCWRCGAHWADEAEPGTTLRVIPGGRSAGDGHEANDGRPAVRTAAVAAQRP